MQIFVTGLVFGNVSMDDARVITDMLANRCTGAPLELDLRNVNRIVQLPYAAEIRLGEGVRVCVVCVCLGAGDPPCV